MERRESYHFSFDTEAQESQLDDARSKDEKMSIAKLKRLSWIIFGTVVVGAVLVAGVNKTISPQPKKIQIMNVFGDAAPTGPSGLVVGSPTVPQFGGSHAMWTGTGVRNADESVSFSPNSLACSGASANLISFFRGFDVEAGPSAILETTGLSGSTTSSGGTVRFSTSSNSHAWEAQAGFVASCFVSSDLYLGHVHSTNTASFNIWNPQTVTTPNFDLTCAGTPKVFSALSHFEIDNTLTANIRLAMVSSIAKIGTTQAQASVTFSTWSDSYVRHAGAAVVAFCPVGAFASSEVATGSVNWAGNGNNMWTGSGDRSEDVSVTFGSALSCATPMVTVGVTKFDFHRGVSMNSGLNMRLRLRPKNVDRNGFTLEVATWATTGIWSASVQYMAVCPSPMKPSCPPIIRRDWADLSQADRDLFVNGFKQLRTNGRLAVFTNEHAQASILGADSFRAHGNGFFLPWHRYFVWELENQIRALGGDYACLSLPYWDWTRLGGQTAFQNPMWNQGMSGNGQGTCVPSGPFSTAEGYVVTSGQCLVRQFNSGEVYQTTQAALNDINTGTTYNTYSGWIEGRGHNLAHRSMGGTVLNPSTAPDDPMFWMLHNFVDQQWALWTDCHNFEHQTSNSIPSAMYPSSLIDNSLSYPVLGAASWAHINSNTLTPRDLVQTARWGYTFDTTMVSRSGLSSQLPNCNFGRVVSHAYDKALDSMHEADMTPAQVVDKKVRMAAIADSTLTVLEAARASCLQMRQHAITNGYLDASCDYNVEIEKCGGTDITDGELDITLNALLSKNGVSGNKCLEDIRKDMYDWAKSIGTLRSLCNGFVDPTCTGNNPY